VFSYSSKQDSNPLPNGQCAGILRQEKLAHAPKHPNGADLAAGSRLVQNQALRFESGSGHSDDSEELTMRSRVTKYGQPPSRWNDPALRGLAAPPSTCGPSLRAILFT
jgi:hypothetical protein